MQTMNGIDEEANKAARLNTPSEASEQLRYNQGYGDGILRAIEEMIIQSKYSSREIQKFVMTVRESLAQNLFDTGVYK